MYPAANRSGNHSVSTLRSATQPILTAQGVWKRFPNGTVALRDVDIAIDRGSIHGLVGANGAGKSTLFKVISGAHEPSAGELRWKGEQVRWNTPAAPRAAGVATMYQHIPLVPTMTVLENVFLGELSGRFSRYRLLVRYDALCERIGYRIDPDAEVAALPIGQRQLVAVAQALAGGAELVLMDEPTASLAKAESDLLFRTVQRLRELDGISFVFCSHFLDEVLGLSDVVTVVRDGQIVTTAPSTDLSETQLVELMVGRQLNALEHTRMQPVTADVPALLEVRGLSSPGKVSDVTFTLRPGEVLGLAGMLGSGRSELLHAIFGADSRATGSVRVDGGDPGNGTVARVSGGMALVPEDRNRLGLIPAWEIWRNTSLPDLASMSWRRSLPLRTREVHRAVEAVQDLGIVTRSTDTPVASLSGGNAQKVVFAKWAYGAARIFLLDEPTVGVDVAAKADILELIRRLAGEGKCVVIVSSEFEELLAVAQRILVVRQGRVVAERRASDTNEAELLALAGGLTNVELGASG